MREPVLDLDLAPQTESTPGLEPELVIPIPRRTSISPIPSSSAVSAIPKHLLRELSSSSPARNSLGLTASPTPSRATLTPSPLGSVDFGLELGNSPRFAKHEVRRPDSVVVDPAFQHRVDGTGELGEGRAERARSGLYRPDHLDTSTPSESYTYSDRESTSPRPASDSSSVSDIGPFDLEDWPLPVAGRRTRDADRAQDIGVERGAGATLGFDSIPARIESRPSSPPVFPSSFLLSYSQDHDHGTLAPVQVSHPASSRASSTTSSPIINRGDDEDAPELSTSSQAIQYRKSDDSTYSTALDFDPSGSGGLYSRSGTRDLNPFSFDDTNNDGFTTHTYVETHFFGEEEDSSMLPPLSTLPEDDPVFTLTPSGSRERGRYGSEYSYEHAFGDCVPPPPSRALS